MASNEIEILDPTATVEKLTENNLQTRHESQALYDCSRCGRRAFTSRRGARSAPTASSGPASSRLLAAGPSDNDILNFILNIVYLEATFYSYVTTGADIPVSTGALHRQRGHHRKPGQGHLHRHQRQQITDLVNELYYDEFSHVIGLLAIQGTAAPLTDRPSISLATAATSTTVVAQANAARHRAPPRGCRRHRIRRCDGYVLCQRQSHLCRADPRRRVLPRRLGPPAVHSEPRHRTVRPHRFAVPIIGIHHLRGQQRGHQR